MLLHHVHDLSPVFHVRALLFIVILISFGAWSAEADTPGNGYYGKLLGKLSELHHGVSGTVYAVDARTLHIRDFTYDGEGPDAFFYVGSSKSPSGSDGTRIRDENGTFNVLKRYRKKHITLNLPDGKTLANNRWFSVWCREFSVNFGDVRIPKGFDYPKPYTLGALSGIHGVSSDPVVVVDAQTLLVPNFSYDGEAPDAKFWVGSTSKPSPQGIRVADENGIFAPLKRYQRQTLVITLPGSLTVHQIKHFGVWCEAFAVDFAHILIPPELLVPPSLRMLGVAPQKPKSLAEVDHYPLPSEPYPSGNSPNRRSYQQPSAGAPIQQQSKLNCEVLHEKLAFEVRWAVAGDSVVTQLVGKIDAGDYMAFGVSGALESTQMIGGDAVVVWVDRDTLQGNAHDYYLDSKSQCAGTRGSCPDQRVEDGANSVRLLNAALVNGYSIVTYQRPLRARDHLDRTIFSNGTRQAIIWAVGPLNSRNEVSYHSVATRGDVLLDFGRSPEWNCPLPETGNIALETEDTEDDSEPIVSVAHKVTTVRAPATPAPAASADAWHIPPIQCYEPEDGVFYAQMGPTGGKHGYPAITGHVGWGISWYINGLLIPVINVVRGKSYTFVVEGGDDPEVPARYHPFYITDDPVGGYEHKTAEERKEVRVFAGVKFDKRGKATPTGTGRLCNWTPDPDYPADESESFGAYQRTLRLVCNPGEPGILRWTPDANTPDTVYYQCYTHRYLGWKINVLDSCDQSGSASDTHNVEYEDDVDAIEPEASIQVDTRVKVQDGNSGKVKTQNDFSVGDYEEDLLPPSAESTAQRVTYITSLTSQAEAPVVKFVSAKNTTSQVQKIKSSDDVNLESKLVPPQVNQNSRNDSFNSQSFTNKESSVHQKEELPYDVESASSIEGGRRNGDVEDASSEHQESLFASPKETETFEPMFIPSPIDRNRIPESDNTLLRHPITPNQLSNMNTLESKLKPTYVRSPVTSPLLPADNRLRPLRRPAPYRSGQLQNHGLAPPPFQSTNFRRFPPKRPVNFGDIADANERVDMYYLPPLSARYPSRSLPLTKSENSGPVLTYDGRPVQDSSLINPPPTEQLADKPKGRSPSIQSSQTLQGTPQFGPFNGEFPPPVPNLVPEHTNVPQLKRYSSNDETNVPIATDQLHDLSKSVVKRWADHEPGHEDHGHDPKPEPEPEPSDGEHTGHSHDHHNTKSGTSRTFLPISLVAFVVTSVVLNTV